LHSSVIMGMFQNFMLWSMPQHPLGVLVLMSVNGIDLFPQDGRERERERENVQHPRGLKEIHCQIYICIMDVFVLYTAA
jgi:hypothetical protein